MEDQNMEPVWHPLCSFHESIWWIAREPFGKRRHNLEGGWMSLWSIPFQRSKSIFHCQFYPVCVTWGLLLVEDCWIACDRSIPSWWCVPLLDSCQGHSEWNQSILSIRLAFLWMQKRNQILTQTTANFATLCFVHSRYFYSVLIRGLCGQRAPATSWKLFACRLQYFQTGFWGFSIGKTEISFVIWMIQQQRQFAKHVTDAVKGGSESVTNWNGA